MPTERALEQAKVRAVSVADQVQLRIIGEKLKAGRPLFDDESALLLKQSVTTLQRLGIPCDSAPLEQVQDIHANTASLFQSTWGLDQVTEYTSLSLSDQVSIVELVASIVEFAKRIKEHRTEEGISQDFDLRATEFLDWVSPLSQGERTYAYHIATGRSTVEELVKDIVVEGFFRPPKV